jgi:integrase
MFNKAIDWGWRTDNPVKGIKKFHEDDRTTWLDKAQLGKLKKALNAYPDQNAANAIRLLILTGSREGEVLKADWGMFDLKRGTWTKPSHHTKQKKIEHVPLSDEVLKLLKRMKPQASGPLFPGAESGSRVTLRRPWVQVCKAAGLCQAVQMKGKRRMITRYKPAVRIHDLRHTFASHLVSNGVSLQIVGNLLGHTNPQTTKRYAHVSDGAMRDATNQLGKIFKAATK